MYPITPKNLEAITLFFLPVPAKVLYKALSTLLRILWTFTAFPLLKSPL
jgi:hypothetical protein